MTRVSIVDPIGKNKWCSNAGHGRTEHGLITILACISICLSEEMKDKCIAII